MGKKVALQQTDESGKNTLEKMHRQVAKSKKRNPDEYIQELIGVEFPTELEFVFTVFCDLSSSRHHGMNGPQPITYTDINQWIQAYDIKLSIWEVETIRRLDDEVLKNVRSETTGTNNQ